MNIKREMKKEDLVKSDYYLFPDLECTWVLKYLGGNDFEYIATLDADMNIGMEGDNITLPDEAISQLIHYPYHELVLDLLKDK